MFQHCSYIITLIFICIRFTDIAKIKSTHFCDGRAQNLLKQELYIKLTTSQKNNKKKNVEQEEEEILVMISMDIYNRIHKHAKNFIIFVYDISLTPSSAKKTEKAVIVLQKI